MIVQTIPISESRTIPVLPLTRESFAPYGTAIANPRPDSLPANTPPESVTAGSFPNGAVSANQGSAIQYRALASMQNLYPHAAAETGAGTGKAATPRMTMFVCGARNLGHRGEFQVDVLERHPFTSQTFIPLAARGGNRSSRSSGSGSAPDKSETRYLVIVAPTLPATKADTANLPTPPATSSYISTTSLSLTEPDPNRLPGAGLPDLTRLTAFLATGEQAVTYAAGTWHAPMVALGPAGSAIDFVVVQFANDVAVEDCQEVLLSGGGSGGDGVGRGVSEEGRRRLVVQVGARPGREVGSKL